MPTQSRANPVALLLTRPEPQAADFARALQARFGTHLWIILTPLLAPRFYTPDLPKQPFAGLILTSQTGVEAFQRLGSATEGLTRHAYCVGVRTADAARQAGLQPIVTSPDAAGLIQQIKAHPPKGAMLHLRGRETRGNIEIGLNSAGIDTFECVVYAQEQQRLSAEAKAVLQGAAPVLAPLFSPRTAAIFAVELAQAKGISPLFVAAMSGEVATEMKHRATKMRVSGTPDTVAMLVTVALLLADIQRA